MFSEFYDLLSLDLEYLLYFTRRVFQIVLKLWLSNTTNEFSSEDRDAGFEYRKERFILLCVVLFQL